MLNTVIAVIKVITVHIKWVNFINKSNHFPCESQRVTAGGSEDELHFVCCLVVTAAPHILF